MMEMDLDLAQLVRRAEAYDRIAALVGAAYAPVRREADQGAARGLPRLVVTGDRVHCDGRSLDLGRRPLTLRLFRAFVTAPGGELGRDAVIDLLYGPSDGPRSSRLAESLCANAAKVVSRARILAATYLGSVQGMAVDWFVFSQERRSWTMYQVRPGKGS